MKELLIQENISLKQAIKILNELGSKTLVIKSNRNLLLGTLSDGDIRKAIANGISLTESIDSIYNKNPKFLIENEYSYDDLIETFIKNKFDLMPVVNKKKYIKNIISIEDLFSEDKDLSITTQETEVIIMAGGYGKRLLPITKNIPKPMVKIGDRSMIQIVIENFKKFGFLNFTISVNFLSEKIISHLKDGRKLGINIEYITEKEPLGTAGSLSLKKNLKHNKSYIVTNSDVLIDLDFRDLIKHHEESNADITICTKFHEINIPYGVVNTNGTVTSIEEKPDKTYWINSGLYILKSSIIKEINTNTYLDMTDLITQQIKKGAKVISFPILGYWKDIGHKDQLEEARKHMAKDLKSY
jgi:dTDP-glucose pyrophosphorylase